MRSRPALALTTSAAVIFAILIAQVENPSLRPSPDPATTPSPAVDSYQLPPRSCPLGLTEHLRLPWAPRGTRLCPPLCDVCWARLQPEQARQLENDPLR